MQSPALAGGLPALLLLAALLPGQEPGLFPLRAGSVDLPAAVGSEVTATATLEIPIGFYISRDADMNYPAFRVGDAGSGVEVEIGPEPAAAAKPLGEGYSGRYERELVITANAPLDEDVRSLPIEIEYMACDDSACYAPVTAKATLTLRVGVAATAAAAPAAAPGEEQGQGEGEEGEDSDRWVVPVVSGAVLAILSLLLIRALSRSRPS